MTERARKKVAIIGAGAAGLVTARELSSAGCEVFVYEQGSEIGGIWVYTRQQEDDLLGVNSGKKIFSSLYQSLRTNLPKDLMAFRDYAFDSSGGGDDNWRRYPSHVHVLKYLDNFTSHFNLRRLIRFNTKVTSVTPLPLGKWQLLSTSLEAMSATESAEFDAIAVCNGHFSVPQLPDITGIERFSGEMMHSHNYRTNEGFEKKRVLVVGAGASGADISFEVAGVAAQVYLCGNGYAKGSEPIGGVIRRPGVVAVEEAGVLLTDGSRIEALDKIIFCTGYQYQFPFLDPDLIQVDDNWVQPLYQDIVHPEHPGLGLIGLPFVVVPFPLYALQASWFSAVVTEKLQLPSVAAMKQEIASHIRSRLAEGIPQRHFHRLGDKQTDYYNRLAKQCGEPQLPDWFSLLLLASQQSRIDDPVGFRDRPLPTIGELS